jgi:hypothetical protein
MQIQANQSYSINFKQNQAHSSNFKQIQANSSNFKQIQANSSKFKQIQANSSTSITSSKKSYLRNSSHSSIYRLTGTLFHSSFICPQKISFIRIENQ